MRKKESELKSEGQIDTEREKDRKKIEKWRTDRVCVCVYIKERESECDRERERERERERAWEEKKKRKLTLISSGLLQFREQHSPCWQPIKLYDF